MKAGIGEVGHLDLAVETLAEPSRQLLGLAGGNLDEVRRLARVDLMIACNLFEQVGTLGRRLAAPHDAAAEHDRRHERGAIAQP
jgi:hypothetical protein